VSVASYEDSQGLPGCPRDKGEGYGEEKEYY
jgi:hypothetical protein